MKKILAISLVLSLMVSMQGCVLFAAGAGAATSAVVVNDRRSLQTMADDQNIEFTAQSQIAHNASINANAHIVVVAFSHAVLLVGQVPSQDIRQKVENLVQALPKVARIYNQLVIAPATSTITRSNDVWITTKVKAQMVATQGLNSSQIKVVTEDSTVYLLGIVTHYQAKMATSVARRVDGVKRVVTLFQYTLM